MTIDEDNPQSQAGRAAERRRILDIIEEMSLAASIGPYLTWIGLARLHDAIRKGE